MKFIQSCNFRNRTTNIYIYKSGTVSVITSARIIAHRRHPFTIFERWERLAHSRARLPPLFPGRVFTLTGLNPFIYPRGWWEGNGWKFSIGRDRPSICRINCFPFVCEFPPEFFASARIRLKSLFAPACFSPSPALPPHLQPQLSAFDAEGKKIENVSSSRFSIFCVLRRKKI